MSETLCKCGLFVLVMTFAAGVRAQGPAAPIKAGLWQTQITGSNTVALPPDVEAKIAAMPAAQQAMIRSRMGGSGGTPTTTTTKSCSAEQTSVDNLMNQAQQGHTKCTFTNQVRTANGTSFDTSCVSAQGTAAGHAEFHMLDSDHVNGSIHMTVDATSSKGGAMHMTIDNTMTSKYLGADCGTVKPGAPVIVQ